MTRQKLKIAFVHPDLGIGGAERLVVDAALGLQQLGHSVEIYTSHHDPEHCFDETRDGTLTVHSIKPPFPRSLKGKFHILLSHMRQLHLTAHLLLPSAPKYDVYFVDQLSTCIPFLRTLARTRVVFYCHFPDKLLADGAYVEGDKLHRSGGILKRMYRFPMDWLEEVTTRQSDIILANSKFTARVFKAHFPSIPLTPEIVYPGINLSAYGPTSVNDTDPDVIQVSSDRPTLLSLNRFERKKNTALAIESFARLQNKQTLSTSQLKSMRLVIAGGYDPRVEDNMMTLVYLIDRAKASSLTYNIIAPKSSTINIPPFNCTPESPDIIFLLNFTTAQRSALLSAPSTLVLLYTPANEHFGIGPVEAMVCGLPVLACDSGGPTESVVDGPESERTGWLRTPEADVWLEALTEIVALNSETRKALGDRARQRAKAKFGMEAMAADLERTLEEAVARGPVPVGFGLLALFITIFVVLLATFSSRWQIFI